MNFNVTVDPVCHDILRFTGYIMQTPDLEMAFNNRC